MRRRNFLNLTGAILLALATVASAQAQTATPTPAPMPEPRLRDQYWRAATIWHVVDGDTVDATIDEGHRLRQDARLRILGIDTPELRSSDPAERVRAQAARDFVLAWLAQMEPMNTLSLTWGGEEVHPFNLRSEKSDSFGRWLADIECQQGMSLAQALLESGNAVPFP